MVQNSHPTIYRDLSGRRGARSLRVGRFGAAHTGNFGGWPVKVLWSVLGLVPALLFVTGALMWWTRVVRKKLGRSPS